ncbi:MAG TPA: glycosyltransferase [Bryobacteraceae bacterium]|nr:glycosyltransferase [Bryobacteraceae bacterium]
MARVWDWVTGLLYEGLLLALVAGSIAYCLIAILAVTVYKRRRQERIPASPPVSVLRPLAGADDNTAANLRSLFSQEYSDFEILLGVHDAADPAAEIVRRVMREFPGIPSRLVVTGPSRFPNAKVWSLDALAREARRNIVIMTDSDVWLPPHCFATLAEELARPGVGLVSCPYRAVGASPWSRLQALGLNTEFISEIVTAVFLSPCDFAIGCMVATRRQDLEGIGGLGSLGDFLAEDFVMGQQMSRNGKRVLLSRITVDHHIGGLDFASCWRHRMRWTRSTRRSRKAGYAGEIFTKSLMVAAIAYALWPPIAPLALIAVIARFALAFTAARALPGGARAGLFWLALPFEDFLSFAAWVAGFFGDNVGWRGRELRLGGDGRIHAVAEPEPEFPAVALESVDHPRSRDSRTHPIW